VIASDACFRLYGAERSYFTGKVRPALRAKRLYFEELPATPEGYREIRRRTGLLFIPVVVTPEDATWQDTSEILDALEARHPEPALYPSTPVQRVARLSARALRRRVPGAPAMHYRWSTPEGAARRARRVRRASAISERGRFADRIMAGTLPALGVTPETIPAIEAHLDELHRPRAGAARRALFG
jgi:glutathione S-transferase